MWIDYGAVIAESAAELAACERAVRGRRSMDRIKLLRLLKSGRERSVRRAVAVLGYTERQGQRWWRAYRTGGLRELLAVRRPGGARERITPAALGGLDEEMGPFDKLRRAHRAAAPGPGLSARALGH